MDIKGSNKVKKAFIAVLLIFGCARLQPVHVMNTSDELKQIVITQGEKCSDGYILIVESPIFRAVIKVKGESVGTSYILVFPGLIVTGKFIDIDGDGKLDKWASWANGVYADLTYEETQEWFEKGYMPMIRMMVSRGYYDA